MRILDLFSGAGGAAMGIHRACVAAGVQHEIVGVDIKNQPRYPFCFRLANAMYYPLEGFDFIWASPPCQGYTLMNKRWMSKRRQHPLLVEPLRNRLLLIKAPFVIENVVGAPLISPLKLCGKWFGLGTVRHRLFETNFAALTPLCQCAGWKDHAGVYGDHPDGGKLWERKDGHAPQRRVGSLAEGSKRMGIDWMEWSELKEAVPPAYSEFIFKQFLAQRPA